MHKSLHPNRGFTLLEVMFVMVVMGLLTVMMIPYGQMILTAKQQSYNADQTAYNAKVAQGISTFVRNGQPLTSRNLPHALPQSADFNAFDTEYLTKIQQFILDQGVPSNLIFSDGTAAKRSRIYQSTTGIPVTMPLFGHSGPNIILNYDYAVVYSTDCPEGSSSGGCVAGKGHSGTISASSYSTWTPTSPDFGAATISTLSVQKELLETTVQRLNTLRDAFGNLYRTRMLNSNPDNAAKDNFFPVGPTTGAITNNPSLASQQGCRSTWTNLSTAAGLPILNQLGLSADYGSTAWGGAIEYCVKYDLAGVGAWASGGPELTANPYGTPPHYAAIRINKYVSSGIPPGQATQVGDNIVLAF